MRTVRPRAAGEVRVLSEDPDLGQAIRPTARERAQQDCITRTIDIRRGAWPADQMEEMVDGIGLLMLDGVLIRRVGINGRYAAELLGKGDLLRPWQAEGAYATRPQRTSWRVVNPVRLAVLDRTAARSFSAYPALTGALAARALNRSRHLSLVMAIVHHPRLDVRLHMLLWHFADPWGEGTQTGTVLPVRLTHTMLADVAAARRPSVSAALGRLADRNLVRQFAGGWLLSGQRPRELLELTAGDEPPTGATSTAPRAEESSKQLGALVREQP